MLDKIQTLNLSPCLGFFDDEASSEDFPEKRFFIEGIGVALVALVIMLVDFMGSVSAGMMMMKIPVGDH